MQCRYTSPANAYLNPSVRNNSVGKGSFSGPVGSSPADSAVWYQYSFSSSLAAHEMSTFGRTTAAVSGLGASADPDTTLYLLSRTGAFAKAAIARFVVFDRVLDAGERAIMAAEMAKYIP